MGNQSTVSTNILPSTEASSSTASAVSTPEKSKKRVTWSSKADVVLIPTVNEFHDAGLIELLWWTHDDLLWFRLSTLRDIREFMGAFTKPIDFETANKLYYQKLMKDIDSFGYPRVQTNAKYSLDDFDLKLTVHSKPKSSEPAVLLKPSKKQPKKVSWNHTTQVVLIPTTQELIEEGLADLLWWTEIECQSFKASTAADIKDFMRANHIPIYNRGVGKLYFQELLREGKVVVTSA